MSLVIGKCLCLNFMTLNWKLSCSHVDVLRLVTRVPPHDGISAWGRLTCLRTSAWEVSVIANSMTFTRRAFQNNVNVSRLIFDCWTSTPRDVFFDRMTAIHGRWGAEDWEIIFELTCGRSRENVVVAESFSVKHFNSSLDYFSSPLTRFVLLEEKGRLLCRRNLKCAFSFWKRTHQMIFLHTTPEWTTWRSPAILDLCFVTSSSTTLKRKGRRFQITLVWRAFSENFSWRIIMDGRPYCST